MKLRTVTGLTFINDEQAQKPFSHILIEVDGDLTGDEKIKLSRVHANNAGTEEFLPEIPLKLLAELATSTGQGYYKKSPYESVVIFPISKKGALEISDSGYISIDMTGLSAARTYVISGIEAKTLGKEAVSISRKNIQESAEGKNSLKSAVGEFDAAILPLINLESIRIFHTNGAVTEYPLNELQAIAQTTNDLVKVGAINAANLTATPANFADLAAVRTHIEALRSQLEARLDPLEQNVLNTYGYGDYLIFSIIDALHLEVFTNGTKYTYYVADLS